MYARCALYECVCYFSLRLFQSFEYIDIYSKQICRFSNEGRQSSKLQSKQNLWLRFSRFEGIPEEKQFITNAAKNRFIHWSSIFYVYIMSNGRPLFAFNEINDPFHFYEAEFAHVCLHEGKAMHEIWLRNHFYFDVCISSFSSHFISLYIILTLAALYYL